MPPKLILSPTERTAEEVYKILAPQETSILCEEGYQDANAAAPEEIKARITGFIKEQRKFIIDLTEDIIRRRKESLNSENHKADEGIKQDALDLSEIDDHFEHQLKPVLEDMLKKLGGDTREQMVEVYNSFDFSSYWFQQGFGRRDSEIIGRNLESVSQQLFIPVTDLRLLDVGTGNARVMEIALNEARRTDPANAENFARNIRGFDLVKKVVEDARIKVAALGIPEDSVFQGDYLALPEEHQREQYHIITAMMHTPWHCTTEKEWITFLKNMERALAPGGCFIFDTVSIDRPDATPPDLPADPRDLLENEDEMKKMFRELLNLYGILWCKYCDDMQPVVDGMYEKYEPKDGDVRIEVPRLMGLPRRFVRDSTAGVTGQSFVREVPDAIWINKLCKNSGIDLQLIGRETQDILISNESQLLLMGSEWLLTSHLREWLTAEIARRILPPQRAEQVVNHSRQPKRKEQVVIGSSLHDDLDLVNRFYDFIALYIAKNYKNKYLIYQKSPRP